MRLALYGGPPVRQKFLPYGHQSLDESDIRAVTEVLHSEWLTTGPHVAEFEKAFAASVGARYAVALSSGTAALHAAAYAAGFGPGDEVVTTPLTFVATANAVLYQNARPVFADVDSKDLNLDPEQVRAAMSPQTKAILPVDYSGHPADLDSICEIARAAGVIVIEDAAHALGASYRERPVGSIADITVFSTHPVKHITTGEGGIATTDRDELANRMRLFRNHGIRSTARERQESSTWCYEMVALGYNYRITDFQCALGRSQLVKLPGWLERRREIARRYTVAFSELPELEPPVVRQNCKPAWHLYVLRLRLELLRVGRREVFEALRAENIGVNVHYIPIPRHPYYSGLGYRSSDTPVADSAYKRMLTLPIFPAMQDRDVQDVIDAVIKVITEFRR